MIRVTLSRKPRQLLTTEFPTSNMMPTPPFSSSKLTAVASSAAREGTTFTPELMTPAAQQQLMMKARAALFTNDFATAEECILGGLAVNDSGPGRAPLIIIAALQGAIPHVHALIQMGADPAVTISSRRGVVATALHIAALMGNLPLATELLKAGVSPNVHRGNAHMEPVAHYAASAGHVRILELLAEHGGDLLDVDGDGSTAVEKACSGIRPYIHDLGDWQDCVYAPVSDSWKIETLQAALPAWPPGFISAAWVPSTFIAPEGDSATADYPATLALLIKGMTPQPDAPTWVEYARLAAGVVNHASLRYLILDRSPAAGVGIVVSTREGDLPPSMSLEYIAAVVGQGPLLNAWRQAGRLVRTSPSRTLIQLTQRATALIAHSSAYVHEDAILCGIAILQAKVAANAALGLRSLLPPSAVFEDSKPALIHAFERSSRVAVGSAKAFAKAAGSQLTPNLRMMEALKPSFEPRREERRELMAHLYKTSGTMEVEAAERLAARLSQHEIGDSGFAWLCARVKDRVTGSAAGTEACLKRSLAITVITGRLCKSRENAAVTSDPRKHSLARCIETCISRASSPQLHADFPSRCLSAWETAAEELTAGRCPMTRTLTGWDRECNAEAAKAIAEDGATVKAAMTNAGITVYAGSHPVSIRGPLTLSVIGCVIVAVLVWFLRTRQN